MLGGFVPDTVAVFVIDPGLLVTCDNKTDRHDISEILLKLALNTIISLHFQYCHVAESHEKN
jgi:hypothetical protein